MRDDGCPDLFITLTGSPLLAAQVDIMPMEDVVQMARFFRARVAAFVDAYRARFPVLQISYSIEWQKR